MEQGIVFKEKAVARAHQFEAFLNQAVRGYDRVAATLHVGGRKGSYDDILYEFVGGSQDTLRKKHYDKSLRLLWKAEQHMPWSSFRDLTSDEQIILTQAFEALSASERKQLKHMRTEDFKQKLNAAYTPKQKQALVNILSLIGHGEAYAWMVSAELLNECKSTGGRAAITMQVLEEAKHFVVLREIIQAFDCPIPRLPVYEYILLERTLKSEGVEKFFGMNVVVEGFALSLFGILSNMPCLEILKMFHRDESRHTALPSNYLAEFPLTWWQRKSPAARLRRLLMVLPAVPFLAHIQEDFAVLGVDSFAFGGSMVRKILNLAERVGFDLPLPRPVISNFLNDVFNAYCRYTRQHHVAQRFVEMETTRGEEQLSVEKEVFQLVEQHTLAAKKASNVVPMSA